MTGVQQSHCMMNREGATYSLPTEGVKAMDPRAIMSGCSAIQVPNGRSPGTLACLTVPRVERRALVARALEVVERRALVRALQVVGRGQVRALQVVGSGQVRALQVVGSGGKVVGSGGKVVGSGQESLSGTEKLSLGVLAAKPIGRQ